MFTCDFEKLFVFCCFRVLCVVAGCVSVQRETLPLLLVMVCVCAKVWLLCCVAGHLSKNCDAPKAAGGSGGGDKLCYKCNEAGHVSRNCPTSGAGGSGGGSNGAAGRKAGGERACYRCGGVGHQSKQCPTSRESSLCFNCGSTAHETRACKKAPLSTQPCPICSRLGHTARKYVSRLLCALCSPHRPILPLSLSLYHSCKAERTCYVCGNTGHRSKKCPDRPDKNRNNNSNNSNSNGKSNDNRGKKNAAKPAPASSTDDDNTTTTTATTTAENDAKTTATAATN